MRNKTLSSLTAQEKNDVLLKYDNKNVTGIIDMINNDFYVLKDNDQNLRLFNMKTKQKKQSNFESYTNYHTFLLAENKKNVYIITLNDTLTMSSPIDSTVNIIDKGDVILFQSDIGYIQTIVSKKSGKFWEAHSRDKYVFIKSINKDIFLLEKHEHDNNKKILLHTRLCELLPIPWESFALKRDYILIEDDTLKIVFIWNSCKFFMYEKIEEYKDYIFLKNGNIYLLNHQITNKGKENILIEISTGEELNCKHFEYNNQTQELVSTEETFAKIQKEDDGSITISRWYYKE